MATKTIAYTEKMVGAGHPSLTDTLNRLTLVGHNTDGSHKGYVEASQEGSLMLTLAAVPVTTTIMVTDVQTVTPGTTISHPLIMMKGGYLSVPSGTVTINGPFEAGLYQVFAGSGAVVFGSGSVSEVYPEWWGAVADGSTDCTAALQAAANSLLSNNGGGVIKLQAGTYLGTSLPHPDNSAYRQIITLAAYQTLRGSGIEATTIKVANNDACAIIRNRHIGSVLDSSILVEDLTLDGNAANQTAEAGAGIAWLRVNAVRHNRVLVKNVRGTAPSGTGEGFHFEAGLSAGITYQDCAVVGDNGSTASGFSVNGCTNVQYVNCSASGMSAGNGFTHNACAHIQYANCRSFLNHQAEFNSEVSQNISYVGCHAGGIAADQLSGNFTINQDLGGSFYGGFTVLGSSGVTISGGSAVNEPQGVYISDGSTDIVITGMLFDNAGISFVSATGVHSTHISNCMFKNISAWELSLQGTVGFSQYTKSLPTQPAFPLTGVDVTNPYPFPALVTVTGSSNSIYFNGSVVFAPASGFSVVIPVGNTIMINYSSTAPTWIWQVH